MRAGHFRQRGARAGIDRNSPVERASANSAFNRIPGSQGTDSLHLSRRQAIAEALTRNAQLEIAREQTAQARARRVTAIAIPDPTLTAAFDQAAGRSRSAAPVAARRARPHHSLPRQVPAQQPDREGGHRRERVELSAAAADGRARRRRRPTTRCSPRSSIASICARRATLAADFLKKTQARYEAGTAAKLDVIQAQVGLAQSDNDLIANERDIATAQASLNRTLGRVIGAPISPTDSLDVPPPLPDSATIEQIGARQSARARDSAAAASRARTRARASSRSSGCPTSSSPSSATTSSPGSPLFTTGISLPLPALYWQHSRGDIAQAQHFEHELDATYRDTRAQVTQDVRSAYANASTAMRQVVFIRDELVPVGARSVPRRLHELQPRRIVGARSPHRSQRAARRAEPTRRRTRRREHGARRSRTRARRTRSRHWSQQQMISRFLRSVSGSGAVVVAASLAACSSEKPSTAGDTSLATANTPRNVTLTAEQRQRIKIVTVQPIAFRPVVEATGNVAFNGDKSTQVLSPVSGPATRIVVTPGAVVTRGQPLAYVSSPDFATAVADYRKAQTAFRNAKRIADRDSAALQERRAGPRRAWSRRRPTSRPPKPTSTPPCRTCARSASTKRRSRPSATGSTTAIEAIIRAPIEGTVVEKLIAEGQLLAGGKHAGFTIADLSTVWVMANVFANDLAGRRASASPSTSSPTRAARRFPAASTTSLRSPIRARRRCRCASSCRTTATCCGATCSCASRSSRATSTAASSCRVASVLRDDQNLPYVFVRRRQQRLRATPHHARHARRRHVRNRRPVSTAGDQVVADGALFLQFAESQ